MSFVWCVSIGAAIIQFRDAPEKINLSHSFFQESDGMSCMLIVYK